MPVTISEDITGVASVNSGAIGGRRNIMYNGEMKVAQRSTSETGLGAATGYFTLDRWLMQPGATAGRFTMAQVADGPPGFANCLKITTTTADTSIAAGEYLLLRQYIEGQDLQQLKKGTASADQFTVIFWVKGNANALYVCEIQDADNTRTITQSFAVTTAWNRIELTFAADTTGAFDDNNAASLRLDFWLHAGSTYSGGTFAVNTWASTTNANRAAVDDFTSIFDATSRTFFITGVQMEIGATATEFESRTFSEELALCQRYYEKSFAQTGVPGAGVVDQDFYSSGEAVSTTVIAASVPFAVNKRTAAPTITIYAYDGTSARVSNWNATGNVGGAASATKVGERGYTGINASSLTDENNYWWKWTADDEL
jgi:hypothetical protein